MPDEASGIRILVRQHYWLGWADIAIAAEQEAADARTRWVAIHEASGETGLDFRREWLSSMTAIAASAFAVDAWYAEVSRNIPGHDERRRRERRGGNRHGIILEALKLGFDLGATGQRWQKDLEWLFKEQRRELVHPQSKDEDTVPLRAGGLHGSPSHVRQSIETATRAVTILLDVLTTCVNHPKREHAELVQQVTALKPSIHSLADSRRMTDAL